VRNPSEIHAEIEEATERRAAVWEELSRQHDAAKSAEAARLSRLIDDLWAEYRAARAHARYGPSEIIITRARAEERLDRESRRRLQPAA
jgi:hypothetical protein